MKATIILFTMTSLLFITTHSTPQNYASSLDSINVDSVLGNGRILQNYLKCLLDKGPCTREGRELKKLLPDALATDCGKCSDAQRRNSQKIITYLRMHKAEDWNKLLQKYDPQGLYQARYSNLTQTN